MTITANTLTRYFSAIQKQQSSIEAAQHYKKNDDATSQSLITRLLEAICKPWHTYNEQQKREEITCLTEEIVNAAIPFEQENSVEISSKFGNITLTKYTEKNTTKTTIIFNNETFTFSGSPRELQKKLRLDLLETRFSATSNNATAFNKVRDGSQTLGQALSGLSIDFSNCDLSEMNLGQGDLRFFILEGANLNGANLNGANLEGAHLEGAHLEGAHLEGAHLIGANLEKTNLKEAYLEKADLRAANLEEAHLDFSHMEWVNLEGANLKGAHLNFSHMEGTHLERAMNLEDAHLLSREPKGTNSEKAVVKYDYKDDEAWLQNLVGEDYELPLFEDEKIIDSINEKQMPHVLFSYLNSCKIKEAEADLDPNKVNTIHNDEIASAESEYVQQHGNMKYDYRPNDDYNEGLIEKRYKELLESQSKTAQNT